MGMKPINWKTLNSFLGLATVCPSFREALLNDPLETIKHQGIKLSQEEQEVFCRIRIQGKDLKQFSQGLLEAFGSLPRS